MRRQKILIVLFLIALGGCGKTTPAPQSTQRSSAQHFARDAKHEAHPQSPVQSFDSIDGRDYLPLKIGRIMRYEVAWSPPVGEPRSAAARGAVEGETEIAGKKYFKQVTRISGIPFSPTTVTFYRSTPQGVCQILDGDENKPEWIYLPSRIEIGDTWTASTSKGQLRFRADGKEDVETPSGVYRDCLKVSLEIKGTLGTVTEEQWLSSGVGVVKQVDRNAFFSSTTLLAEITTESDEMP